MDNKDNHWKLIKSCQESTDLKLDGKNNNPNNPNNNSHNNGPRVPRLVIQVKKVNLFPNLPNLNPATNANNNESSSWQSLLRPSILTDAFKKPESHENPSNPPLVLQEHSNSAHRNGTPNTLGSTVSTQNGSKRPKKRALSNPDIPYHDSSKRSHHKSSNSEAPKQCGLNLVPATIPTIAGKSNTVIDGFMENQMARKLMRRYSAPIKPFCRGDEKQLTNQAKNRASVIKFTQSTRETSVPENLSIRPSVPNAPSISNEQIVRQERNVPDVPIVPDEPMGDQPMIVDLVTVDKDLASTKYFLCEACYTSFKGEKVFRQHLQDHISIDQPLNCNPCNVSFRESDQLIRHQKTQSHIQTVGLLANRHLPNSNENHRPFVCTDCNISYSISEKLSKHLRSKGHLMRLEAENKIPYGMCESLELFDIDFESIDDTDSASCLASLLRLAESMYAIGGQMPREPRKVQKPQDLPIESSSSLSILLRPPPPLFQINQSNGSNASDNCGKVSNLTAFTSMGKATNPTQNVSGSKLSKSNISFVDSIKTSSDLAKRKREPDRRHRYNLRRSSSSNSALNETTGSSTSTLSSSSLPLATSPPSEQGNPTISSESLMLSAALSKTSLSSAPHTPVTLPVDKLKLPTLFAIPSTSSAPTKPLVPTTELPAPPPLQKITPPSNVLPIETIPRKSASMHRPSCEYCNKVLNTLKALQVHYFIEHPDKLSHYN